MGEIVTPKDKYAIAALKMGEHLCEMVKIATNGDYNYEVHLEKIDSMRSIVFTCKKYNKRLVKCIEADSEVGIFLDLITMLDRVQNEIVD